MLGDDFGEKPRFAVRLFSSFLALLFLRGLVDKR